MKQALLGLASLLSLGSCTLLTRGQCGDEIIDQNRGEECDGGADCDENCKTKNVGPICGDTLVEAPEECDDGNSTDGDGCSSDCQTEFCGDGLINNTDEACDDGNAVNNDACKNDCTLPSCGDGLLSLGEDCEPPGSATCDANCNFIIPPDCGDGNIDGGEECDDNNTTSGDGCNALCLDEFCGDGTVNLDPDLGATDECDDGNTTSGDGCNIDCLLEFCGDGTDNNGALEECDDGNAINTDDCKNDCSLPVCGDNIISTGEQCEPPNSATCDALCQTIVPAVCGDGLLDPGEECDDGNTSANDGCADDCLIETPEIIVDCGTGDTIQAAVNAANANNNIIEVRGACSEQVVTINGGKDVIIRGSNASIVNAANTAAVFFVDGAGTTLILENISISISSDKQNILVDNGARVALRGVELIHPVAAGGGAGNSQSIRCKGASTLLVDQSNIRDNARAGAIFLEEGCKFVIVNSLIQNNSVGKTIELLDAATEGDVIFSTFANNNVTNGVADCANATGRINSIVGQAPLGNSPIVACDIENTNVEGFANANNNGNSPLLDANLHLTGTSPGKNAGDDGLDLGDLSFDPLAVFGINVFDHDKDGNKRTTNRDMGAFEDF